MIENFISTFCLLPSSYIFNYCYSYSTVQTQLEGAANKLGGCDVCKIAGRRKESFILHIKFSVPVCCDRLKSKSNMPRPIERSRKLLRPSGSATV